MDQASTDDQNRSWAEHAVGGADTASLHALATADPTQLTGAALVDAITASEKALSLLTGIQLRLLAAFSVPFVAGDPMRLAGRLARKNRMHTDPTPEQIQDLVPDAAISLAGAEVAAALRISPVTAGLRVREAVTMTTSLAPTLESLEHGIVDRGKARVIAEHCEPLTPEHTAAVQDMVLPAAGDLTTSELRDFTGQAVITIDPHGADERHQASAARRSLAIKALPDAMATLSAFLPADGAVKIFQVSDLLATSTAASAGDNRGIAARRVDALVDIAEQLLTYGHLDLSEYLGQPLADSSTLRERPSHPADHETEDRGVPTPDINETACPAESFESEPTRRNTGVDDTAKSDVPEEASSFESEPTGASTGCTSPSQTFDTAEPAEPGVPDETDPDNDEPYPACADVTNPADPFDSEPIETSCGATDPGQSIDSDLADLAAREIVENPTSVTDASARVGGDSPARVDTNAAAPVGNDPPAQVGTVAVVPVDTDSAESAASEGSVEPAEVIDHAETAGNDGRTGETTPTRAQVVAMPTPGPPTPPDRIVGPDPVASASSDASGARPSGDQAGLPARTGQRASGTFTRQGRRPHLSVTLGLGTLAGFDNLPGKLEGFGAIPAGLARSIAISAASITTQLVDGETGIATHAGSLTYRPRQELRDQVATLNGTCRFPSCRQPVWRCDLDHREPFDHADPSAGGPTSPDNLAPYCRRHHLMKHHTDWRVRPDRDSYALHFTSPTGHRYTKQQNPAAPHSVWMDNQGAAFADRLDNIVATTKTESSDQSTGVIEELLTAALLRHHLTPRPREYAPDKEFWATTDLDSIGHPRGHDHATEAGTEATGAPDLTVELSSPADDDSILPSETDDVPPPF